MTDRYVRSTDGNNSDNGSTWALAKATIVGVAAIDAAGDRIFLSSVHSETTAGAVNPNMAGSIASPQLVLSVNDGAEPPTALAAGAVIDSSTNAITYTNVAYTYGITFKTEGTTIQMGGGGQVFDTCTFHLNSAGVGVVNLINTAGCANQFVNCSFKFSAAGQTCSTNANGNLYIKGGSVLSGGTSPSAFFGGNISAGTHVVVDGFDFSQCSSSMDLVNGATNGNNRFTFRDCKMPASWTGLLAASTPATHSVLEMFNCDSGDTHYRYRSAMAGGTIADETTLVRTGGASDGTTTYSLKLVTNSAAKAYFNVLETPEMVKWNTTVNSSITVTVEILHDSATNLKDNEVWLEVMYLGTSGYPLASFANDAVADVLATAADQTTSSETWTTTGMSNPNKQKVSKAFTPQEEGFIHAKVRMGKASYTLYVDPKLTVS